MEDHQIIALYCQRQTNALAETQKKYGRYLLSIANHILSRYEDSEECVNDTYLAAWNSIPPQKPGVLSTYLGKITRRISIDRWRARTAGKRGGSETDLALEELEWCVSGSRSLEDELDRKELIRALDRFLGALPEMERRVFLQRYWAMASIGDICALYHFSESKVASMLHRTRKKLRTALEKEGFR